MTIIYNVATHISDSFRRRAALAILLIFIAFTLLYLGHSALPGNNLEYPLGWWGWADQGEYLKSAKAFHQGNLDGNLHHYPPIWSLLGAFFVGRLPMHAFFVPMFVCFAVHVWSLLRIGETFYPKALSWAIVAITLIYYSSITTIEWIIPWTSTASAAIGSLLFLIFFHFDRNRLSAINMVPFEWLLFSLFFICYGALFATRPLEIFSFFPLAIAFFIRAAIPLFHPWQQKLISCRAIFLFSAAGICGAAFPVAYLLYNKILFGHPFGGYFEASQTAGGYFPAIAPLSAVSLWFDSVGLSAEPNQAIVNQFGIFPLALAVCCVSIFAARGTIGLISLTILVHLLIYLPYADLTPNNLFRFNTIHYFKWTFPWLALIMAGQLIEWIWRKPARKIHWWPLLATAVLFLLFTSARITIPNRDVLSDQRDAIARRVVIDNGTVRYWSVVDVVGAEGGYKETLMDDNLLIIDNRRLRRGPDYRLVPTRAGIRILFIRPETGREISLTFVGPIKLGPQNGVSFTGEPTVSFTCAIRTCQSKLHSSVPLPDNLNWPDILNKL